MNSKNIINILAISFAAIFVDQVGHETTHGLAALISGAKWTELNLFYSNHMWTDAPILSGEIFIAGSAAVYNIIVGLLAAYGFNRQSTASHSSGRLFLFYLAIFNTFSGFGYLLTDPLFYQKGGANLGDWKYIIDILGGGWGIRLPILLIGIAGTLWMFLWIGRNAHAFFSNERMKSAIQLLLIPYLVWCTVMTILGFQISLPEVSIIIAISYFFGYFGVFWGTFMSGLWMKPKDSLMRSELPNSIQSNWLIVSLILLCIAVFVLLPTVKV